MRDSYWLPPRKARLCRGIGAIFLIAAVIVALAIANAGISPGASPSCGGGQPCAWKEVPAELLDQEVRIAVLATPARRDAFAAYAAIWAVEAGLEARRDLDRFV